MGLHLTENGDAVFILPFTDQLRQQSDNSLSLLRRLAVFFSKLRSRIWRCYIKFVQSDVF